MGRGNDLNIPLATARCPARYPSHRPAAAQTHSNTTFKKTAQTARTIGGNTRPQSRNVTYRAA
eukprot:52007-Lingulodinium_polyedra.AAC.1